MGSMPEHIKRHGEGTSEQWEGVSHRGLSHVGCSLKVVREDAIGGTGRYCYLGKRLCRWPAQHVRRS